MLILTGSDIEQLLLGREQELLQTVRGAYEAHARKHTSVPHSVFLRFPDDARSRIIALPAYLGEDFQVAGIKWVSSFPGNLSRGLDRASAVMLLNSTLTGRPEAMMEASIINAKRTAASAALAAEHLIQNRQIHRAGIVGCGPINFETVRFLTAVLPSLRALLIYDTDTQRAKQFKLACEQFAEDIQIASELQTVLHGSQLVSFATTAGVPYVTSA
ncbi:MAG TPA: 2,3-diaminopropionate biosynthesis protein SbnB, partial [Blastocatellia bacterium]